MPPSAQRPPGGHQRSRARPCLHSLPAVVLADCIKKADAVTSSMACSLSRASWHVAGVVILAHEVVLRIVSLASRQCVSLARLGADAAPGLADDVAAPGAGVCAVCLDALEGAEGRPVALAPPSSREE